MQGKGSAFCGSATSLEVRYTGKPVSGWGGLVSGNEIPGEARSAPGVSAGVARMPSAMTLTRYFGGLVRSQIEHLSEVLGQFALRRLRAPALGAVLDLDSTVFERYGRQQGSLKGYNPRKHGRPSHHPLLAMLAEAKLVLHAWLRSGNTA